ncbi:MAG: hypothetical protein MJ252_29440, partial [archaeon]|nr:hypothetical protein [archaeon]
ETYYNKLLDVKNNLTVFKEFSKTSYENKGFKGFIKRKFTLRKNTFYEIIEDDLSYSFYTLNISNDIDKITFIKSDIFPSFTDEKRKYSHMIKYNDNTVLFISDEGKMELFNIESKRFTSVDSNIFGNNINIKNILSVYSLNEEEFSFSFIDGIIIRYKF